MTRRAVVAAALALLSTLAAARVAGAQRPEVNYDEARVPAYTLPDLFGGAPRTRDGWRARRDTLLAAFRAHVYGRALPRPERVAFHVVERDAAAMGGRATLRRVAVESRHGGRAHRFELVLFVPNARAGRVPTFLLLNNRPATNTDPTRRTRSGFWPAEELIARGYGVAALQVRDLAPDDTARFRDGALRLFAADTGARAADATGALGAWAWGASRAMDYLETDPRVDPRRVAVVGHSRGGKAALWAGAQDERFALVVSNESGEGGAALARRAFGETIERVTSAFPHWFAPAYASFAGREAALPVDQHMLLALVAPRAVYVASAADDRWADPRGEFLALAESSPAFALWGDPPVRAGDAPPLGTPLVVGRRGYHVRPGGHDLTPFDWARFADFADALWRSAPPTPAGRRAPR